MGFISWLVKQVKRIYFVSSLILASIRRSGGVLNMLKKASRIWRYHGFNGVKQAFVKIRDERNVSQHYEKNYAFNTRGLKELGAKADKKNILIVSHEASRTGAPILSLNIVDGFSDQYNVVSLLLGTGDISEFFQISSDIVIVDTRIRSDYMYATQFITKLCSICSFDFAVVNSIESRNVIKPLTDLTVPVIGLFHEFSSYTYPKSSFRDALLGASLSVFSTRLTLNNALEPYLDSKESFFPVIPQGQCRIPNISTHSSYFVEQSDLSLEASDTDFEKPKPIVVIGAGAVQFRKGVDLFIECATQVLKLDNKNNYKFIWVGGGYAPKVDMSYSVYLQDQIKRAGLEKHFTFIGELLDMSVIYNEADILLISSRLDPLPNVGIDALWHGLPTVCFNKTTGIADYLLENGLGEYCVANYINPHDMAQKVFRLASDIDIRKYVSDRTKIIASKFFSMENYLNTLRELTQLAKSYMEQAIKDKDTILGCSEKMYSYMYDTSSVFTYIHTWRTGIESLKPKPGFHPGVYADNNLGTTLIDPYADYLRQGKPYGSWNYPVIQPPIERMSRHDLENAINCRVALHIHAYYPELLVDILKRIEINYIKPDLFITVTTSLSKELVLDFLRSYSGVVIDVVVCPNLGRNIGPLLSCAAEALVDKYKYIGHVHTKKSINSEGLESGGEWRNFLFEHLLGGDYGENMIDTIVFNFEVNQSLQIIYPEDFNAIGWSSNKEYAYKLMSNLGLSHLPDNFNFPVGAMCWFTSTYLKMFLNLSLTWDDYPVEPLPYDGSMLHALERLFGAVLVNNVNSFAVTHVDGVAR